MPLYSRENCSVTCHAARATSYAWIWKVLERTLALKLAGFVTTRYFLFDYINANAYHNNQDNLDELKADTSNISAEISPTTLQAMATSMPLRAQLRMKHARAHIRHYI